MPHEPATTVPHPPPAHDSDAVSVQLPQHNRSSWQRFTLFALFICGATISGYFAFRSPQPLSANQLTVDQQTIQLGQRKQGELIPIQFRLVNHYPEPIEIQSVVTGCSCLVPTVSRKHLAPQQETIISLNWHTGTRRGEIAEAIWVLHTIPTQSESSNDRLQLAIVADILPDVRIEPTGLEFQYGQPATKQVRLSPGQLEKVTIREAYANSAALSVKHHPDQLVIDVTYTPKSELDTGAGIHVAIGTNSKNEPTIRIPVRIVKP